MAQPATNPTTAAAPNIPSSTAGAQVPYDPSFTAAVIAATGPHASPRLREVVSALIRHVHDFAREVRLTTDEYMMGVEMMNWAGRMR